MIEYAPLKLFLFAAAETCRQIDEGKQVKTPLTVMNRGQGGREGRVVYEMLYCHKKVREIQYSVRRQQEFHQTVS